MGASRRTAGPTESLICGARQVVGADDLARGTFSWLMPRRLLQARLRRTVAPSVARAQRQRGHSRWVDKNHLECPFPFVTASLAPLFRIPLASCGEDPRQRWFPARVMPVIRGVGAERGIVTTEPVAAADLFVLGTERACVLVGTGPGANTATAATRLIRAPTLAPRFRVRSHTVRQRRARQPFIGQVVGSMLCPRAPKAPGCLCPWARLWI
jgi:hypothetical protein